MPLILLLLLLLFIFNRTMRQNFTSNLFIGRSHSYFQTKMSVLWILVEIKDKNGTPQKEKKKKSWKKKKHFGIPIFTIIYLR